MSSGDPALATLYEELSQLPRGDRTERYDMTAGEIAVPLRLRSSDAVLSFISTVTTFGTATDITVAELSIESFFPADAATVDAVHAFAGPLPLRR